LGGRGEEVVVGRKREGVVAVGRKGRRSSSRKEEEKEC
jgi:hypothetical protein